MTLDFMKAFLQRGRDAQKAVDELGAGEPGEHVMLAAGVDTRRGLVVVQWSTSTATLPAHLTADSAELFARHVLELVEQLRRTCDPQQLAIAAAADRVAGDAAVTTSSPCPFCGAHLRVDSFVAGSRDPTSLSVGVCIYCGRPHVIEANGDRREPSEDEAADFESHETIQRVVAAINRARAAREASDG